jgi:hypothetical protein
MVQSFVTHLYALKEMGMPPFVKKPALVSSIFGGMKKQELKNRPAISGLSFYAVTLPRCQLFEIDWPRVLHLN